MENITLFFSFFFLFFVSLCVETPRLHVDYCYISTIPLKDNTELGGNHRKKEYEYNKKNQVRGLFISI